MPLYLIATPIGNLEDMTLRAIRMLKEVDLIACEDTRHTRRLLDHFGISTATISYHEHNEKSRAGELVERLRGGRSVALVTDAGTPGISDPAYRLVCATIEAGIEVIPIPGPTAFVAALVASGLPTDAFLFGGFLPPKRQARRSKLEQLKSQRATLVFYEAPHRIRETLTDALAILGDRRAVVARELTKLHEQFLRGSLAELTNLLATQSPRGEMTLVIAGNTDDNLAFLSEFSLADEVDRLAEDEGMDRKEALKTAARRRGIPRREAYQRYLEEKEQRDSDDNESPEDRRPA